MNQSETERARAAQTVDTGVRPTVKTYNRWQLFFLDRMQRLIELEQELVPANHPSFEIVALRQAVFSTLLDCDKLGVGDEARMMLGKLRAGADES